MKLSATFLLAALVAPAAYAQVTYYESDTLTRGELRECMARDDILAERRARLDAAQADVERESSALAREGAELARELRRLDTANAAAVADHNARNAVHNRRVHEHNQRVAGANERAARLNAASADMDARCARPYRPRDRDIILMERGSLR